MNTKPTPQASTIPSLVASKDVAKVRDELAAKYDMYVSDQFAADLIVFVEQMTNG